MRQAPFIPAEAEPHERTWLAFVADESIWMKKQIAEVKKNLAEIARTVAQYEPVSILVRAQDHDCVEQLLGNLKNYNHPIKLLESKLDDLWIRDTGPLFVIDKQQQKKTAINLNFNGWGNKQKHKLDARVAGFVAANAGVELLCSSIVMEGGGIEVDGQGTAIMTESCILNDNRNKGKEKIDVELELKALFGLEKIIWLKGVKGKDITDGHVDFYARFVKPGLVVVHRDRDRESYDCKVTYENIKILQYSIDAKGNPLKLIVLDSPSCFNTQFGKKDFAPGYAGFYLCNGAVIMQKFGDAKADNVAREKLEKAFPKRKIEQISIDGIASGGGTIHCVTLQEAAIN